LRETIEAKPVLGQTYLIEFAGEAPDCSEERQRVATSGARQRSPAQLGRSHPQALRHSRYLRLSRRQRQPRRSQSASAAFSAIASSSEPDTRITKSFSIAHRQEHTALQLLDCVRQVVGGLRLRSFNACAVRRRVDYGARNSQEDAGQPDGPGEKGLSSNMCPAGHLSKGTILRRWTRLTLPCLLESWMRNETRKSGSTRGDARPAAVMR
jgi:hypothetical protein